MEQYVIPKDLYYTQDDAWVKVEGSRIRIGVSDFMQKSAGELTFIRLPRSGKPLAAGVTLTSVQSGKWAGKILAPMTGTVVEANTELATDPALMNRDCYGAGWICVMEPEDLAAGQGQLVHGDAAEQFFAEEYVKHIKK